MKLFNFSWLTILSLATAGNAASVGNGRELDEPGHMSLPNLLTLEDSSKLDLGWELADNIRLDTGRLLIGTGGGSLWLAAGLAGSAREWTVEMTFRSTGVSERDLAFRDHNSLSLWFTSEKVAGAGNFDGIRVALSNKQTKGLKIYMNDGTKFINDNVVSSSVGSCDFNFLDSTIPFTVRVSYSAAKKWFKVQVDNSLCFKTDSITIPESMGDLRFGITADVATQSQEEYEIFNLNVWNQLTGDAIDDHALMGDGSVIEERVPGNEDHTSPGTIRQSLMERNKAARETMQQQQQNGAGGNGFAESTERALLSLSSQIESIVNKIDKFDSSYDTKVLLTKFDDLSNTQLTQRQSVEEIREELVSFKSTLTQQFAQLLAAISKLNERVIGEVREQQYGMEEVGKKVDLLMNHHKEVAYQYQKEKDSEPSQDDFIDRLISKMKWFLIALCIVVMFLATFVYRLRHDIKHSKLL